MEFEVQHGLIQAIPDANIKLHKQLLKVSCDKMVSHLLEICRIYYAVESEAAAMCVGHVVHVVCHAHQTHDPKLLTSYTPCPNCTHQHPPGRKNCPASDLACKGCGKKGYWQAECHSCNTTSSQVSWHQPSFKNCEKVRENHKLPKLKQRKDPHTKTCSLLQWTVEWLEMCTKRRWTLTTSVPSSAMKHTQSSNCLQAPAVKALPQSASRLTPNLEVSYYPSICSNSCIQNKPAQMACPLAWTPYKPN